MGSGNVLEPQISSRADYALLSVYGTLFLTGAVAAARADDRASATSFLNEATDCPGRLGRAYTARNRRDDALRVMLEAEQVAPEQIHHHAISRQLVLSWLRNTRRPRSMPLEQLAGRLHLA